MKGLQEMKKVRDALIKVAIAYEKVTPLEKSQKEESPHNISKEIIATYDVAIQDLIKAGDDLIAIKLDDNTENAKELNKIQSGLMKAKTMYQEIKGTHQILIHTEGLHEEVKLRDMKIEKYGQIVHMCLEDSVPFIINRLSDGRSAKKFLDILLKHSPQNPDYLIIKSNAYDLLARQYKNFEDMSISFTYKGIDSLREAIKLHPDYIPALTALEEFSRHLILRNKYPEEAISYYKSVAKLDSTSAAPYYYMAGAYQKLNDSVGATTAYLESAERAIKNPNSQETAWPLNLGVISVKEILQGFHDMTKKTVNLEILKTTPEYKKMYDLMKKHDPNYMDVYTMPLPKEEQMMKKQEEVIPQTENIIVDPQNDSIKPAGDTGEHGHDAPLN